MNKEQMDGKFDQIKGKLKSAFGKLTDNDIMLYNGKRDQFIGKITEMHGIAQEEAEKKVKAIEDAWKDSSDKAA